MNPGEAKSEVHRKRKAAESIKDGSGKKPRRSSLGNPKAAKAAAEAALRLAKKASKKEDLSLLEEVAEKTLALINQAKDTQQDDKNLKFIEENIEKALKYLITAFWNFHCELLENFKDCNFDQQKAVYDKMRKCLDKCSIYTNMMTSKEEEKEEELACINLSLAQLFDCYRACYLDKHRIDSQTKKNNFLEEAIAYNKEAIELLQKTKSQDETQKLKALEALEKFHIGHITLLNLLFEKKNEPSILNQIVTYIRENNLEKIETAELKKEVLNMRMAFITSLLQGINPKKDQSNCSSCAMKLSDKFRNKDEVLSNLSFAAVETMPQGSPNGSNGIIRAVYSDSGPLLERCPNSATVPGDLVEEVDLDLTKWMSSVTAPGSLLEEVKLEDERIEFRHTPIWERPDVSPEKPYVKFLKTKPETIYGDLQELVFEKEDNKDWKGSGFLLLINESNTDSNHLANFFVDKENNVIFADAQANVVAKNWNDFIGKVSAFFQNKISFKNDIFYLSCSDNSNKQKVKLEPKVKIEEEEEEIEEVASVPALLGADVNQADKNGETPLHIAARDGHAPVVAALLGAGADVKGVNNHGQTALHIAAANGHVNVVNKLLEAGAEVNQADNNRRTALHYAAFNGHEAMVAALLDAGADRNIKNTYGQTPGQTPLQLAARNGHADVVAAFLERGADVNQADKNGETPLHWAAQNGHADVVNKLLEAGAEVNQASKYGETPLHWAARYGHAPVVAALLRARADPSLLNKAGESAISIAEPNGNQAIVKLFKDHAEQMQKEAKQIGEEESARSVELGLFCSPKVKSKNNIYTGSSLASVPAFFGSDAGVNQAYKNDNTQLHIAALRGHVDAVAAFLERGADVNQTNKNGETPLHGAAQNGHVDVVAALLLARAEINKVNKHGRTPLHIAAFNGHVDVVNKLLEAGANGLADVVAALLELGANVNQTNKNGETPLHGAAQNGLADVVAALLELGANVNQTNKNGETPLYDALRNGAGRK